MGGTIKVGSDALESEPVHQDIADEELLGLQMTVWPDGSDSLLTLHTTMGRRRIAVAFDQMPTAYSEIRQGALVMLLRQSMAPRELRVPMSELARTARRPTKVAVVIDKQTGDRLFVQQFADGMPVVTRMSPEAVDATIDELSRVSRQAAN